MNKTPSFIEQETARLLFEAGEWSLADTLRFLSTGEKPNEEWEEI